MVIHKSLLTRKVNHFVDSLLLCYFVLNRKTLNTMIIPNQILNPKKDLYELKIQVNDLKPIQRFMRGIEVDVNTK